jgi:HK97 gp10 family phage protein
MARMTIYGLDELAVDIAKLGEMSNKIAKDVVMAGAQPVADEIRADLRSLPVDKPRYLESGDEYNVVTKFQLKDLDDSLGITPPDVDRFGNVNTKVGFDGYGSYPTEQYPKGLPNQLLARAVESGSSVRKKTPFIRPAVNRSKKRAIEAMRKKYDEEIKKIKK